MFPSDTLEYKWERFSFKAGGFFVGLNSDLSLGLKQVGSGINVNLEDALGLETSSFVFRSDLDRYFGKRKRGSVKPGYYGFNRSSTKIIASEIEFYDQVYGIGIEINSRLDIQMRSMAFGYTFYSNERAQIGASLGFFAVQVKFSIETINFEEQSENFIAPLPIVGFHSNFAITPKLHLRQNINLFYLETEKIGGNITDLNVNPEYNIRKNPGVGIGINNYRPVFSLYDNIPNKIDFAGSLKTGYTGALIFAKFSF